MYNRLPRGPARQSILIVAIAALVTVFGALPAEAHTTGPQLISSFDRIDPPAPGVDYSLLSTGSAPYVTVAVHGNHTFDVYGLQGEPFIRITQDGVQRNRNSPSLYLTIDPSKRPATPPASVDQTVSWEKVSDQPEYHYYETRAEWPHTAQPDEARRLGRTAVVFRFAIPAGYDGQHVAIEGHVTWIPAPINLEVPLLFVPLVVVALLWLEPKAKPYVGRIARGLSVAVLVGAALDAARLMLDYGAAPATPASLALLPGLVLVPAVAVPRLLKADRRAYAWVMIIGVYLVVFGLLRPVPASSALPALGTWLRRAEVAAGFLVAGGAGLLLFLSSPMRPKSRVRRTYGPRGAVKSS